MEVAPSVDGFDPHSSEGPQMLQCHASRSRLLATAVAVLAAASAVNAQVITGIAGYGTTSSGNASNALRTNTQGGDFLSNTYITRGTNPSTDAFLYTGNATGNLLGSGITLNAGANTFSLWGFTEYGPANWGVSPFTGPNTSPTNPTLSSWYSASASTLSAVGLTGMTDFNTLVPAGPLSALLGGFNVAISEFSFATVSRAVFIGSYDIFDGANRPTNVAKLVLTATPVTGVVPEPSTYVLMASGLGMLRCSPGGEAPCSGGRSRGQNFHRLP